MDEVLLALPFYSLANSTDHSFASPPFRPSLTLIPLRGTTGLHGGVSCCGGTLVNTRNRCEIRPYDAKKSSAKDGASSVGGATAQLFTNTNNRSLRLSKGHVCKELPVLRRGEVFLLPQTIRSLGSRSSLYAKKCQFSVGVKFFATTNNPHPEALEGSVFAKKVPALRQAQGPHFDRPLDAALRVQYPLSP